jgi:hypothetical protein
MEIKNVMHAIRLAIGAAKAESEGCEIADEFVPQVAKARAHIATMRGSDVVAAVVVLERSGLGISRDVRKIETAEDSKSRNTERRAGMK